MMNYHKIATLPDKKVVLVPQAPTLNLPLHLTV